MPTKVTWTAFKPGSGPYDSQVHVIRQDVSTTDLRAHSYRTLCGVRTSLLVRIQAVKTWCNRPCQRCVSIARKEVMPLDLPRVQHIQSAKQPKLNQTTHKGSNTTMAQSAPARKINFGEMGKALPAQVYDGIFDSFKYAESKGNAETGTAPGKPMYQLIFTVADEGQYKGRKISRFFVVEGNALFYFFDALTKLGADAEELSPVDAEGNVQDVDVEPIMRTLIGAHAWLRVSVGEYKGRESNSIDEIISYNNTAA